MKPEIIADKLLAQSADFIRASQEVPIGYVLVPIIPTAAMVDAMVRQEAFRSYSAVRDIYHAAIHAALKGKP